jgi:hypothetical protein
MDGTSGLASGGARIVPRPRGSVGAGPSAARGRGGHLGDRGSARSRPTASAHARGSVPLEPRRSGSCVRRRRWRLVALPHLRGGRRGGCVGRVCLGR